MCFICLQLDKDFPFPTPKELARNINEVLPTEQHMKDINVKIHNKLVKPIVLDNGQIGVDFTKLDKYKDELSKELVADLFKHRQHDLRES